MRGCTEAAARFSGRRKPKGDITAPAFYDEAKLMGPAASAAAGG